MTFDLEKLGQEFAEKARQTQGAIRKEIKASLTAFDAAKLVLHDKLADIERRQDALAKEREDAWEVFDRAALEHSASLLATNQMIGEPSNVTKLQTKDSSAA